LGRLDFDQKKRDSVKWKRKIEELGKDQPMKNLNVFIVLEWNMHNEFAIGWNCPILASCLLCLCIKAMGIGAKKCLALALTQIRTRRLRFSREGERKVEEDFVHPDEEADNSSVMGFRRYMAGYYQDGFLSPQFSPEHRRYTVFTSPRRSDESVMVIVGTQSCNNACGVMFAEKTPPLVV
jgi:hypothetical protein